MKPTAFGKYLLLERIAVGGMAEVFLAKSFGIEGFERILAIKRILPQLAEDKAFIGMFIDEARIAGQLGHANVTPIYELGKVGSAHYIAMEHVWGKDLLQIMNRFRRLRTRMPAGMVAFIAARACEALDYAHHKRDAQGNPLGLIHRDVSPQNVLVSYDGAVKLIDFGVAKAKSRTTKTQAGVVKGKFGYMSPEQVKGKKIDLRSDVFALGTCLYEMITLERLFAEDTDFATMDKIRKAKIPPPSELVPGLPPALDEVVMKALAKDPGKRYQTAAEVQEALTRIVMTEEPRFGAAALADWMQMAFAEEMAQEKARLDSYARVKLRSELPGEPSSGRRLLLDMTSDGARESIPPSDSTAGGAAEATEIGPLPLELPEEAWPDEPTQIFFSSESPFAGDTSTGDIPAPVIPSLARREGPDTTKIPVLPPRAATGEAAAVGASPVAGASPIVNAGLVASAGPSASAGASAVATANPVTGASPVAGPGPVAGASDVAAAAARPTSSIPPAPPPVSAGARARRDSGGHDWSVKEPPTGWLSDGAPVPGPVIPKRGAPPAREPDAEAREAEDVRALPAERTPRLPRGARATPAAPKGAIPMWKAVVAALFALALGAGGTLLALDAREAGGHLEVHVHPGAASRVRIDGVYVGTTPLAPRPLRPGTHVVDVEAEGFRPVTRPITVRPEGSVTLHVELAPDDTSVSRR